VINDVGYVLKDGVSITPTLQIPAKTELFVVVDPGSWSAIIRINTATGVAGGGFGPGVNITSGRVTIIDLKADSQINRVLATWCNS
jgi:hypothetical protein